MRRAVAVDFGASSGRFALGTLEGGKIAFEVTEQIPHAASERDGRLEWDLDTLLGLCRRAADYAAAHGAETIGIDTWGVDHGFLDENGELIQPPVCYRDLSHVRAFERLAPHRERLYALTGAQHQPFNTICQLVARAEEDPTLPQRATWMILPDLLGYLLSGERNHELTQASTTQLLGLDNQWSPEAFAIAGWPVPALPPSLPGRLGGSVSKRVRIAHVGSHDTASAVAGFGELGDDEAFLNVGTWSLIGTVVDAPIATPEAERANLTNERTVDGRVRLLKNVPGSYVINRVHEELGVSRPVAEWLANLTEVDEIVDLNHADLFNPESMVETCARLSTRRPANESEWAGFIVGSLASTLANELTEIARITGRTFRRLRVGGGGSQAVALCQGLSDRAGLPVVAGPVEVTVLGNLAVQFLATGAFPSREEMNRALAHSSEPRVYGPTGIESFA